MARQIDYYFSVQSPWAYIGHALFQDLANAHQLKVNYKPVLLVDLFSETGGLPLTKRHPARQRYRLMEMQRWRDKRGLNFHFRPKAVPLNARVADGVVLAALEAGFDVDPYLRRGFSALWEQDLDLADPDVVAKVADEAGLPGKKLVERSDVLIALWNGGSADGRRGGTGHTLLNAAARGRPASRPIMYRFSAPVCRSAFP